MHKQHRQNRGRSKKKRSSTSDQVVLFNGADTRKSGKDLSRGRGRVSLYPTQGTPQNVMLTSTFWANDTTQMGGPDNRMPTFFSFFLL